MMLKPQQWESVKCMYKGKDVFLWLPTGFGKLICYEVLFCAPEAIVCGSWSFRSMCLDCQIGLKRVPHISLFVVTYRVMHHDS